MITRTFAPGEIIFREGEESTDAFFLTRGRVRIRIRTPDGPRVLSELGPGEIFGEMGLIEDAPRSATAEALEPTEVEAINAREFAEQVLRRPERLHRFLSTLFERLRHNTALLRAQGPGAGLADSLPVDEAAHPPRFTLRLKSHPEALRAGRPPVNLILDKLPFLIGRDGSAASGLFTGNDLNLGDQPPFQVSPAHCAIEQLGPSLCIRDRGSARGTIVNGQGLGAVAGGMLAALLPGENDLVLGTTGSTHRFTVSVQLPPG